MDTNLAIEEVKKLSPQKGDIVCLQFEENIFDGDYDSQLSSLGKKLKNEHPNIHFIMLSKKTNIKILKDKKLKSLGLKRI